MNSLRDQCSVHINIGTYEHNYFHSYKWAYYSCLLDNSINNNFPIDSHLYTINRRLTSICWSRRIQICLDSHSSLQTCIHKAIAKPVFRDTSIYRWTCLQGHLYIQMNLSSGTPLYTDEPVFRDTSIYRWTCLQGHLYIQMNLSSGTSIYRWTCLQGHLYIQMNLSSGTPLYRWTCLQGHLYIQMNLHGHLYIQMNLSSGTPLYTDEPVFRDTSIYRWTFRDTSIYRWTCLQGHLYIQMNLSSGTPLYTDEPVFRDTSIYRLTCLQGHLYIQMGKIGHHSKKMSSVYRVSSHRSVPWRHVLLHRGCPLIRVSLQDRFYCFEGVVPSECPLKTSFTVQRVSSRRSVP